MSPPARAAAACAAGFVAFTAAVAPAAADVSVDQCIAANDAGQTLRRDGKLAEARAQLLLCGDPTCPRLVRADCARRLDALERAQPTIVFDVKDAAGNDLAAVKVSVDGRALAARVTGTPLQVDPGEHEFAFEAAGAPPVVRRFVIKEGEKDRRERIVIAVAATSPAPAAEPGAASEPAQPAADAEAPPRAAGGMGTQRLLGLVAGGSGLVGIAAGSVFGLLASSALNAQKQDCPSTTTCPNRAQADSDHATLETDGAVSTVAFIAGGALLAAGALLFFTAGGAAPAPAAGLVVVPSVGTAGGGVTLRARF